MKLVRRYTNGIVFADPVKRVAYDAAGRVAAETAYFRDVLTYAAPR